ncbi:MAG: hypothetical protein MJ072_04415, partial [Clostridia bacterium]|nr:hypothetical protein [Clostridia bacterium]
MKTTKELTITGVFVALLLGGQFALAGVSGVEIVTVLLLSFCYVFGPLTGVICATAFSLLRCLIFGFSPTVVILYLVFYNACELLFGSLGKKFGEVTLIKHIVVTVFACVFTLLFTLFDDVITPFFYSFSADATVAYFYASLPVMV